MEVPHMSDKTVLRFVEHGYRDVFQILNISIDTLMDWEGFSTISSQQLVDNMYQYTHKADTMQWIHAGAVFGRGIGKKHIQHLLKHAPALFTTKTLNATKQNELRSHLLSLRGYQEKTVQTLLEHHPQFIQYWKKVKQHMGKHTPPLPNAKQNNTNTIPVLDLDGKSFCFSGVRDKTFQKLLEDRGASVVSSVSKHLNTLVCKSLESTSDKMTKAKQLSKSGYPIQIMTLETCKEIYIT